MSQPWIRSYRSALHNPKIQRLPAPLFKAWQNLLWCTDDDGELPPVDDIAFILRASDKQVKAWLAELSSRALFDALGEGRYRAHDWSEHQKKSDTSNDRVKQHRERKKAATCNVTGNDTREDTETETDQTQEARARNFEAFWRAYPHPPNASRALAEQAWSALGEDLPKIAPLLVAVDMYRAWINSEIKRRGGEDPPPVSHAANWLTERRFEGFLSKVTDESERAASTETKRQAAIPSCWRDAAERYAEKYGWPAWDAAVAGARLLESDPPAIEFDRVFTLNFAKERGALQRLAAALGCDPIVTVKGGKAA